jgi:hypothetical protein
LPNHVEKPEALVAIGDAAVDRGCGVPDDFHGQSLVARFCT